jgi:hypothetical protein
VVGFPSLASSSMEQGRLAACHAFGVETNQMPGRILVITVKTSPSSHLGCCRQVRLSLCSPPCSTGASRQP